MKILMIQLNNSWSVDLIPEDSDDARTLKSFTDYVGPLGRDIHTTGFDHAVHNVNFKVRSLTS